MSRRQRVWKKVRPWLPFALVALLLYLLVKTVEPAQLVGAAKQFNGLYLLPLAASYVLYLGLRSARWHLLIRTVRAPNSLLDSVLLFAAAQAAVLIPAGQFLLPVLQKSQHGTLIRRSAATVLVQELLFGLLVLPAALPGVPGYRLGGWLLLAAFLVSIGAGVVMIHQGTAEIGIVVLTRIPLLRRHIPTFRDLRDSVVLVVNTPEAVVGSVLDLAAIAAAGTGLYIVLAGLGQGQVGWTGAVGTYAFGNAVATLSSLPGGLGANEDVSTAVLSHMGLAAGPAAVAVIIFRAVSLLLGTAIGWAALLIFRRRFKVSPTVDGMVKAVTRGEHEAEAGIEPGSPKRDPAILPIREDS